MYNAAPRKERPGNPPLAILPVGYRRHVPQHHQFDAHSRNFKLTASEAR